MKHEEARKLVSHWESQEPNKFKAWTWYGRGLKEAERWQVLKGNCDVESIPFGMAVAEFQEHWRYEVARSLEELSRLDQEHGLYDHLEDHNIIGGIINTSGPDFNREDHPYSAESQSKKKNKK